MKQILVFVTVAISIAGSAQNVGIGTTNPQQKLDVNGAVKIGSNGTDSPVPGTMRWNEANQDFEGFNGSKWLSLTGGKSGLGSPENYIAQTGIIDSYLKTGTEGFYSTAFGRTILPTNNRLVVSAEQATISPGAGSSQVTQAGIVMVYENKNGSYSSIRELHSPAPGENFYFGTGVDCDSKNIVVGERAKIGTNNHQGTAHVYGAEGIISLQASLVAPDAASGDFFGNAVTVDQNRIAVGAPGKTVATKAGQGRVYFYTKSVATWGYKQFLFSPENIEKARFGASVSMKGNYLAVGAPGESTNSDTYTGKVFVYTYSPSSQLWVSHKVITPQGPESHAGFGYKVRLVSEDTLLVVEESLWAGREDRVFIYTKNSSDDWIRNAMLECPDGSIDFGTDVDLRGKELIIGAYEGKVNGISKGKAYVYRHNGTAWEVSHILTNTDQSKNTRFGGGVMLGEDRILVGASSADGYYLNSGVIYEFLRQ